MRTHPRRTLLAAGVSVLVAGRALARGYEPGDALARYPDPDIVVLDKRFASLRIGPAGIERLYTGTRWAEGTAWNAAGRYLVWSDIPNNRQLRWMQEDGHVGVFRQDVGYSNGNTFDFQGRQISCQQGARRVVRYEHDGALTVLASSFNGKPLNGPNDVVVHPDGSVWFTDPGYGIVSNYEGDVGERHLKEAVYRVGNEGAVQVVTDEIFKPNGICFSPDYKSLYVSDTGATHYPRAPRHIKMWSLDDRGRASNGKSFASMKHRSQTSFADGIRADKFGNIYASTGWVGDGFDGVHVFAPEGKRIGIIRLPETAGNLCFGGPKRNRLFIAGSKSLYAVFLETQGAHIT